MQETTIELKFIGNLCSECDAETAIKKMQKLYYKSICHN